MICALKGKPYKEIKKVTKNRMGNLMIVILQLTVMNILTVNYFLLGLCTVMSRF